MPQQTPPPAEATTLLPGQVTVAGNPLASASDVYQAFRAQRRELGNQMDGLESAREDLSTQLAMPSVEGAAKTGLEQRITAIDARITALDKQIADADAQVAKAAAIPGAAVEPPEPPRTGPPEEAWVLGGMFIVVVLLPLSIAYARRIWRRSAKIVTNIPKELSERLMRVEQTVEASAVEIERIGEGQRFMTRLFTEGPAAHALPAGVSQPAGAQSRRPDDARS
ncbi:MAG: hypothetical protein ABI681_06245 [Gemmatimonadales bacterium]